VYFIPKLRSNIVSLGQLDEEGCKSVLNRGFLSVFDRSGELLARALRTRNRLYALNLKKSMSMLPNMEKLHEGAQVMVANAKSRGGGPPGVRRRRWHQAIFKDTPWEVYRIHRRRGQDGRNNANEGNPIQTQRHPDNNTTHNHRKATTRLARLPAKNSEEATH
jgi:hypothetical protein